MSVDEPVDVSVDLDVDDNSVRVVATERHELEIDDLFRDGELRLWEDQHRSIVGYDAQTDKTGWYVFVLKDEQGTPQVMRRVEPSTVTRLVGGDWNEASHEGRDARQYKLPIDEVFDQ